MCTLVEGERFRVIPQIIWVLNNELIVVYGTRGLKTFIFNNELKTELQKCEKKSTILLTQLNWPGAHLNQLEQDPVLH